MSKQPQQTGPISTRAANAQDVKQAAAAMGIPIDVINWDSDTITTALRVIDMLQGIPLMLLRRVNSDLADSVETFLQKVEDYINEQRTQPAGLPGQNPQGSIQGSTQKRNP